MLSQAPTDALLRAFPPDSEEGPLPMYPYLPDDASSSLPGSTKGSCPPRPCCWPSGHGLARHLAQEGQVGVQGQVILT